MSSGRSTIEPGQSPHKPAESGVPVGNAARFCSFQEVTRIGVKQAPLNKLYIPRTSLSREYFHRAIRKSPTTFHRLNCIGVLGRRRYDAQPTFTIKATVTEVSLNLLEDLSNALADLARMNGQSVSHLTMDVLRDYIEHERTLTAQIELAVEEADQGKFASDDQVAAMRARRWSRNAG